MAGAREPTSEVTMDAQAAIIAAVYGYAGGSSGESRPVIPIVLTSEKPAEKLKEDRKSVV